MLDQFTRQTKILLIKYVPTRQITPTHISIIPQHQPTGCDIIYKTYRIVFLISNKVYTREHLLFTIYGKIRKRSKENINELIQRFFRSWSLIIHSQKISRYLSLLNPEYSCLI
jgi:hypothetical protein